MQKYKNDLKNSGFTLLEIIIVLVIIGVMTGIAALSVSGSSHANFLNDANKIAAMFELLGDNAVYTNSVIACDADPSGLSCDAYKNGDWNDLKLSRITSWQWPDKIKIEQVLVNGLPIRQGERLYFYPNGNVVPTSVRVGNGVYHTWIDNDLSGNYAVTN